MTAAEDQAKLDILRLTGAKFFPGWSAETGLVPDPWITLKRGTSNVEIHVPKAIQLIDFEEEAWWQFKKTRDAFDLDEATEAANDD